MHGLPFPPKKLRLLCFSYCSDSWPYPYHSWAYPYHVVDSVKIDALKQIRFHHTWDQLKFINLIETQTFFFRFFDGIYLYTFSEKEYFWGHPHLFSSPGAPETKLYLFGLRFISNWFTDHARTSGQRRRHIIVQEIINRRTNQCCQCYPGSG